ncbi:MAG: YitT family protein [Lachnospiraceae bacterium]|nr:YitT family protein [Lachnospiraceae bacterium]
MKRQLQRETSNMLWAILGVACYAAAYRWFLVPADLYSGGFTGVSQLIKLFLVEGLGLHVPKEMDLTGSILWCINLPLFVLGYKSIGKKFLYRTIIAVCIQSVLLTVIPAPDKLLLDDLLLNCVVGGVLSGFGVGITLRAGGSGGGTDIVGMYCAKHYPEFGVGKLNMVINLFVYTIAAIRYDVEVAAYSMIFSIVAGIMMDRVHDQNIKVSVFVVTKEKGMGEKINRTMIRGVTSWKAWGEYSRSEEIVHMVVVNKYELLQLKKLIRQEDPHAFVQVMSPDMIIGNFEKRLEVQ